MGSAECGVRGWNERDAIRAGRRVVGRPVMQSGEWGIHHPRRDVARTASIHHTPVRASSDPPTVNRASTQRLRRFDKPGNPATKHPGQPEMPTPAEPCPASPAGTPAPQNPPDWPVNAAVIFITIIIHIRSPQELYSLSRSLLPAQPHLMRPPREADSPPTTRCKPIIFPRRES